jgi:hypothetical protein
MVRTKAIRDPLGNLIQVPHHSSCSTFKLSLHDIRQVVTSPAFIIQIGLNELYFFRLLDWELNLMVEVKANNKEYIVNGCTVNPSVEFISSLLEKGKLTSLP